MFLLRPEDQHQFRDAVDRFSNASEVRATVHALYQRLADATELRQPLCRASGRCCNFESFGHRLYVTTMEFATFLADLRQSNQAESRDCARQSAQQGASPDAACGLQRDGLCTVHAARPFGCRVYFCDATAVEWQREQYEWFQRLIRKEHHRLGVPYMYVEWTQGLKILGLRTGLLQTTPGIGAYSQNR